MSAEVKKRLRSLRSRHDVGLRTFNCPYEKNILGGDPVSYSYIENRPIRNTCDLCDIPKKGKTCDLCEDKVDSCFEWEVLYDHEKKTIDLNLCLNCNSVQKIWDFIFNSGSMIDWIFGLLAPNNLMTHEMFFLYLKLEEGPRKF